MRSQELRKQAPELDPLRLGTGWKMEDLEKPQILIESSFGDSHPGSVHLLELAEKAKEGAAQEGGYGARYFCTDICDGEAQGHDGMNYSLPSRDMMANMIEIHSCATPFDGAVIYRRLRQKHAGASDGGGPYQYSLCRPAGRRHERRSGPADPGTDRGIQRHV